MTSGNYNSNDDFKVKGDDGSIDGQLIAAIDDNGTQRLAVDAVVSVSPIPNQNVVYKIVNLLNGASKSMDVNGSGTPVNFSYSPGTGEVWYLESISILLTDGGTLDPDEFGSGTSLTNGVDLTVSSGGSSFTISNMKDNMDVAQTFPNEGIQLNGAALFGEDGYQGTLHFDTPIRLDGDSSDYIRMVINDNITAVSFFTARARVWRII